jgi:hypothetical protein
MSHCTKRLPPIKPLLENGMYRYHIQCLEALLVRPAAAALTQTTVIQPTWCGSACHLLRMNLCQLGLDDLSSSLTRAMSNLLLATTSTAESVQVRQCTARHVQLISHLVCRRHDSWGKS